MKFAADGAVNLMLKMKGNMIIENLDLKPKIDAMMRDFLNCELYLLIHRFSSLDSTYGYAFLIVDFVFTQQASVLCPKDIPNLFKERDIENVRIVGNVYPVPDVVDRDWQQTLAVHWVLDAAKKRRGKNSLKLEECLFAEIMDAYKKKGKARKKRQELRKIDAINRSYSHFRWW
ncbi:ribosomal protein S7 [Tanacetum coccineum]|uniref:Ribosomal protein S7 n=1 Tax=Tanacetum coccineum TaxID=301880 RepID=A0ABQ5CYR9_9ASTR